jgi:hypothetical protein
LVETTEGSPGPGLQLWDLPGSTCRPIVLTPGASWGCTYPRWLTGEGNGVEHRTVAVEASIADGTTRSFRAQTTSAYDDVVPGATLSLDASGALAARDGRPPAVEVRVASTTPESIVVDAITVRLDGAEVADAAADCHLPALVTPAAGLRCTVSVPLAPGRPGQVTVDATYRDDEGNAGTLRDGLVLQVAPTPGAVDGGDGGGGGDGGSRGADVGDVAPPPPARRSGILPVTGAPLRARARQGALLVGAGLALVAVGLATDQRRRRSA